MKRYETIVLGLGATGSAAIHQLARRGNRVLGIDRHSPPHQLGSTHGDTRITRLAIGEGAQYTPLALRSHELWRDMERETGESLLTACGGLIISSSGKTSLTHVENFFGNTLAAAEKYGVPHEVLDAAQIRRRFPQFNVANDERGYFEADAGFLRPEACIRAQLALAEKHGAELHRDERVAAFEASGTQVTVTTESDRYAADRLIVAAGPWLPGLVDARLARYFKVHRQVMYWFAIQDAVAPSLPERWPVFIWELQRKSQGVYGFPAVDGPHGGVKVSTEAYAHGTTPMAVDRNVTDDETDSMYEDYVAPYISGLSRRCLRAATCLYTVTPDFGFVIDAHPDSERVIIASPCSGHGFKHAAAIGEALAQRVVDGASRIDLSAFRLSRFHPV
jgi:sarcosine oxidase